jgi:hypothetical protein
MNATMAAAAAASAAAATAAVLDASTTGWMQLRAHLLANAAEKHLLTLLEAAVLCCQVVQLCSSLLNPLLQLPDKLRASAPPAAIHGDPFSHAFGRFFIRWIHC